MSIFDNKCIEGDQSNQISEVSEMSFECEIIFISESISKFIIN